MSTGAKSPVAPAESAPMSMAFPEKLLKTIATTRCAIFSLKFTKNRLVAGLDSARTRWGSLSAPRNPLAPIWGLLLRGGKGGERKEGRKWKGREGMGGKEKGKGDG